jgi:Domain of unknown function (DUF1788)
MPNNQNINIPQLFESLFKILSSQRFLNKEGLGGNKAIFVQPYNISKQRKIDSQINSLVKRLTSNNIPVLSIDLYELSLSILGTKGVLHKVFETEGSFTKREFKRALHGSLDTKTTILPSIMDLMKNTEYKLILIHGVDKVFPFLSMVSILVNIQSILNNEPVVFFYPGEYDNYSLNLFGRINEDNEYRAFNLNNYN